MSTSAANIFNPRMIGSSSSENDVDEVFLKQGGGSVAGSAKSRCFSDPAIMSNGKDSRQAKSTALSDSSNVLKRIPSQAGGSSLKPFEGRTECSTIPEDQSPDGVFAEPESLRQRGMAPPSLSFLMGEDDENQLGGGQFPHQMLAPENGEIRDVENEFPQDLFDSTRNASIQHHQNLTMLPEGTEVEMVNGVEEEDDSAYPEIERFPSGYGCCPYDDEYQPLSPVFENTRLRRAYDCCEGFPELPNDLIKETNVYPKVQFDELDFIELPHHSPKMRPEYEMKLQRLLAEDSD